MAAPQFGDFLPEVPLRTRFVNQLHLDWELRPYTINREGVVFDEYHQRRPPGPVGREPQNPQVGHRRICNRLLYRYTATGFDVSSRKGGGRVDLRTAELLVDSFYPQRPFAEYIAFADDNSQNVRIDNLVPLWSLEDAQDYYIDSLENKMGMEFRVLRSQDGRIETDEYLISEFGDVFSLKSNIMMVPRFGRSEYYIVKTRGPRRGNPATRGEFNHLLHRAVCFTFNGDPDAENMVVDHIDNDRHNNHYSNLRWATNAENIRARTTQPARRPTARIPVAVVHRPVEIEWRNVGVYTNGRDYSNYEVSNTGLLRRIGNPPVNMNQHTTVDGYHAIDLVSRTDGRHGNESVHRLVAWAFLREHYDPDTTNVVNHIDENRANNYITNLEWVTTQQNVAASRGVPVRRTNLQDGTTTMYNGIYACVRDNAVLGANLRHRLCASMTPVELGSFRFERLAPIVPRPPRGRDTS